MLLSSLISVYVPMMNYVAKVHREQRCVLGRSFANQRQHKSSMDDISKQCNDAIKGKCVLHSIADCPFEI